MKLCKKCNQEKSTSEFLKRNDTIGGLRSWCKSCENERNAQYRVKHGEKFKEYQKKYRKTLLGKEAKTRHINKYPEKAIAVRVLNHALDRNKITRHTCEVCGCAWGIQGHHWNYSLPLDVTWLCPEHHRVLHSVDELHLKGKSDG